jgi:hypothetical protein
MIVWNEQDLETREMKERLRQSLAVTFPFHPRAAHDDLWNEVRSEEEFQRTLSQSLNKLRTRILNRGQVMKRVEQSEEIAKPRLSITSDAK